MTENTYLIIGLGNPGREYKDSRHNVGFMLIDRLAVRLDARGMKLQSKALITSALHEGRKLMLAKPQTYMNLSGQSVQGLLHFYKIPIEQLIVAHDDLDIPFGDIKLKIGGGEGGHNGLRDTTKALGTKDYVRVRVGVGRPPGRMEAADYVLRDFTAAERKDLGWLVDAAADAVELVVTEGLEKAQLKYHTKA